jgi:hypothetical protein
MGIFSKSVRLKICRIRSRSCHRPDQTVILTAIESAKVYPDALRRVTYYDLENERRLKTKSSHIRVGVPRNR